MKRMALLFALAFAIITLGCSGETNKKTPVNGDKRSGAKMDVSGACFRDSVGICHFPVIVNDNFDNVNSKRNVPVRDYAAKGGYVDNDLVPIVIGVKDGVARSVTLTDKTDDLCLGGACARGVVRFWADKQKREEITLPKAFKGDEMPKTIYAEGLSAGGVSSYLLTADKDDRSSIVFATNTIELTTTTELTVSDSDGRKVPTGWKNLDAGIVFKLHGWELGEQAMEELVDSWQIGEENGNMEVHIGAIGISPSFNEQGFMRVETGERFYAIPFSSNDKHLDLPVKVSIGGQVYKRVFRIALGHWTGTALTGKTNEERDAEVKTAARSLGIPSVDSAMFSYHDNWNWREELSEYGVLKSPLTDRVQYCEITEADRATINGEVIPFGHPFDPKIETICIYPRIWSKAGVWEGLMSTLRHENRHVEQLYEISPLYPEETLFRRITHALGHQPGDLMETDAHLLTILDADADYESVTSHIAHFLLKDGYWRGAIKTVEELKGLGYVEVAEQLREYLLNYYERIPWNDLKVEDAGGDIVRP